MTKSSKSNLANWHIPQHPSYYFLGFTPQFHTFLWILSPEIWAWILKFLGKKSWITPSIQMSQSHLMFYCSKWPLSYQFLTIYWDFCSFLSPFCTIFWRSIFFKIFSVGLEGNLCCWLLILAQSSTRKLPQNVKFFMEGEFYFIFSFGFELKFINFIELSQMGSCIWMMIAKVLKWSLIFWAYTSLMRR